MTKDSAAARTRLDFSYDVQEFLLRCLLGHPTAYTQCRAILDPIYFDDRLREPVRFIMEHADTYRELPPAALIGAKTGVGIEAFDPNAVSSEWLLNEVEEFCRYRAMENVLLDAPSLLERGLAGEIEQRMRDALTIRLISDLGTDYFADPRARLEAMRDNSAFVPTGWDLLDRKLHGGFTIGGLNIFAGGSGCVVAGTTVRVIHLKNI